MYPALYGTNSPNNEHPSSSDGRRNNLNPSNPSDAVSATIPYHNSSMHDTPLCVSITVCDCV